jgi:Cu+-exporting ATPase
MSCAGCASRVERALLTVPGVTAAAVNLQTERVRVSGSAAPAALMEAIRTAGYEVRISGSNARSRHEGAAAAAALILAAPLMAPMLLMLFGVDAGLPVWLQLALASVVQVVFGARFYRGAWAALRAGAGNMDTLVVLGTSAAFGLSLWDMHAGGPLYFEASAAIIALVRTGKWLEGRARRQAGGAIRALERMQPERVRIRRDGADTDIKAAKLRPGDVMVVRPGERFAADGVVQEGEGTADESLLTGETRPVPKRPGDTVVGGALNGEALLLVAATTLGAESRLGRMVRLMEDAQAAKAPVQRLVDRVSSIFVPVVVGLAVLTFAGWLAGGAGLDRAVVNAVSVLVIACPCALGLATPAATAVGIGAAARYGILLRDPAVLEHAGTIRTIVFDKTGTLTEGRPHLVSVTGGDAVLRLAAALQAGSIHPLARTTAEAAAGLAVPTASALRTLPGRGVAGTVEGRRLLLGNARLLGENGLTAPSSSALEGDGDTVAFLAEPGVGVLGSLTFGDTVRPAAAAALAKLRARGMRIMLLTGDNAGAAAHVAAALGITEVQSGALPEDKADRLAAMCREGPVAMVGDGVNDAAALAAATLGIAVAGSTDVADAAAGITLMRPDLALIPAALDIASRTQWRIKSGLVWAFAYNLIGIPMAAAGLLNPVIAGATMALSSAAVVGNALLLRRWRP